MFNMMSNRNYKINKLNKSHINEVAKIWKQSLKHNIKSIIGSIIIKKYLIKIIENNNSLINGIFFKKKLLGFIIFNNDEKIIFDLILKNIPIILFSFIKNIFFLNFQNVYFFFNVILYLFFLPEKNVSTHNTETELLIIAINKNFRNKKLGSKLIKESFKNKYFNSFKKIKVITLKNTPNNIYFYQKNGFIIDFEYFGRVYLNYYLKR